MFSKKMFLFLIVFPAICLGQTRQIKIWKKDQPLTWSDFKAPIDISSPLDAVTSSGDTLLYQWHIVNKQIKLTFTGYSIMIQSRSWARTVRKTDKLLRHEQLHFDISELFLRRLLKILSNTNFSYNFEAEIKRIVYQEQREREAMQSLYDAETQHSQNSDQQKKWEEHITELLN